MDNQINALVAKHIMGWRIIRVGYYGVTEGDWRETPEQVELKSWLNGMGISSIGDYLVDVENDICKCLGPYECGYHNFPKWEPDKNIADAWEVMKRIENLGWEWRISRNEVILWRPEWVTSDYGRARPCISARGKLISRVICLAALKTVGMEIDNERP